MKNFSSVVISLILINLCSICTQASTIGDKLTDTSSVAHSREKEAAIIGSVAAIPSEVLEKRTITNISKVFDGLLPGVFSTLGSSQPGADADILIRNFNDGKGSINPVFIIDGIIYLGSLSAINPNDIESIEVLKDAFSSALYGHKAKNGVILIKTKKRNTEKKPVTINFKGEWGVSSMFLPRYQTMDEKDYMETAFQIFKNDFIYDRGMNPVQAGQEALTTMSSQLLGVNEQYNPFNYSLQQLINPETGKIRADAALKYHDDWLGEATNATPFRQEYYMAATGNWKNTSVTGAFGYLDEDGLLRTTGFERYTARLNAEIKPVDWFSGGLGLYYAKNFSNLKAQGNNVASVFYFSQRVAPIYPVYMRDPVTGELILDANGNRQYDRGINRPAFSEINAIDLLNYGKNTQNNDNIGGVVHIELNTDDEKYGFFQGFQYSLNFGVNSFDNDSWISTEPYNYYLDEEYTNKGFKKFLDYTFNQSLSYTRRVGAHTIGALIGYEYYKKSDTLSGEEEIKSNAGHSYKGFYINSGYTVSSPFFQLNYNFKEKYYLSANFRKDTYRDKQYYDNENYAEYPSSSFWSLGAAWNIKKEAVLKTMAWLDRLNIKASYGVYREEPVLFNRLYTPINSENLSYFGNTYSYPIFNTGIDIQIYKRLSLTAEYYNKTCENLIPHDVYATGFDYTALLPVYTRNQGWEFTIHADIITNKSFNWQLTCIGQTIKNTIIKIGMTVISPNPSGNLEEIEELRIRTRILKKGEALNTFYIPSFAGVDGSNGNALYLVYDTDYSDKQNAEPYLSTDKNKATRSPMMQGNRLPDFVGSFTNNFGFLNHFALSVQCNYSIGGKVLDYVYADFMQPGTYGYNFHKDMGRAWKQPGDITDVPLSTNDWNPISTSCLLDASYFSIKHISLSYRLPQALTQKIKIDSVRLFVNIENVAMFSTLKGMNPQYNFAGTTTYGYMPVRTSSFGIDIML